MSSKQNVLVFPSGTEIGLEIHKSLSNSIHFQLYGASSISDHGELVYKYQISSLPFFNDKNFLNELNILIDKLGIDFLIPAHDDVLFFFSKNKSKINSKVICSDFETIEICRSKLKTYNFFKNIIKVPKVYDITDSFSFPLFLKPDVGQGSQGIHYVENQNQLEFHTKVNPSLLILEYLPGKEFTVDCFTDKRGNLRFSKARTRSRIRNGISVNSSLEENNVFYEIAVKINSVMKFKGVWFFQVKEDQGGDYSLLEVAPRVAGSMGYFRNHGINFILLSIFEEMGLETELCYNSIDMELDRALVSRYKLNLDFDNVYVDLDDTLIIDRKVNTELISLLYQFQNESKVIVLITKHLFDVGGTLKKYNISQSIFSKIIHLKASERKSKHISSVSSIFIDDSFSERKDVFNKLKIPCFGTDGIECLFNYKR